MTTTTDSNAVATRWDGPLGTMLLCASARGLRGVWFEGQAHGPSPAEQSGWTWVSPRDHVLLAQACHALSAYFAGRLQHFELPLDLSGQGTPFQQSVWQALAGIGHGQTCRYGELAAQVHRPRAVRAVGAAVGRNPLSIVLPCHRVLGASGQLTGYAGGLERKQALLDLERLGQPVSA